MLLKHPRDNKGFKTFFRRLKNQDDSDRTKYGNDCTQ